jgi:hypothetical protein
MNRKGRKEENISKPFVLLRARRLNSQPTRFAIMMSGLPGPLASGTTPTITKPHF